MNAKLLDAANVEINAILTAEKLASKRQKIAQKIQNNAKIDGFRKGKVPLSIIEARFGEDLERDSQNEALRELLEDALKSLNIEVSRVIGAPIIKRFDKKDDGIHIEAKVGIFPQFDLDYTPWVPGFSAEAVSAAEIEKRLDDIATQRGEVAEIAESRALKNGDIANIDFEGFLDGAAFEGGKASGFDLEIGSKSFVEGFEEQLLGLKKGESKELKITFPEDYQAPHLAGKEAIFKVALNLIKTRKKREINDDFAKEMLPKNLKAKVADLRDFAKSQLEIEAKNKAINAKKPELIDILLDKAAFDLPETIVEQEMDVLFRANLANLAPEALKELQDSQEKAKAKRESFRTEAQKSVKLTFIVDYIAKKNNITVSENELYQVLYYEAMMTRSNPQDLAAAYEKNNMLPALRMSILENKVLNFLLEGALKPQDSQDSAAQDSQTQKDSRGAKSRDSQNSHTKDSPDSPRDSNDSPDSRHKAAAKTKPAKKD